MADCRLKSYAKYLLSRPSNALAMARVAHREGYPEIGLYWEKAAWEVPYQIKIVNHYYKLFYINNEENLCKKSRIF